MKKIIFLLFLIAGSLALPAQTGLFNLSYAIPIEEADSLLALSNFYTNNLNDNFVRYYPKEGNFVDAILVFVEPTTRRMIGWFIKYNPNNTEEDDAYVLKTLQEMHGKNNHYDEETSQLIWFLSTTRTVHIMYADDNSLTVLYYDSYFPDLFRLPDKNNPEMKSETQAIIPPADSKMSSDSNEE
ncbi:MAG: hypothetical protein ABFC98_06170 [Candidatus Cloacimonas sp.]